MSTVKIETWRDEHGVTWELVQLSLDEVAASVGLGTGTNLRLHFRSVLGTTPSEYRRTFTKGE